MSEVKILDLIEWIGVKQCLDEIAASDVVDNCGTDTLLAEMSFQDVVNYVLSNFKQITDIDREEFLGNMDEKELLNYVVEQVDLTALTKYVLKRETSG